MPQSPGHGRSIAEENSATRTSFMHSIFNFVDRRRELSDVPDGHGEISNGGGQLLEMSEMGERRSR
ncbi:hypothetical protein D3C80_2185830 [compost metagenome]